MKSFKMGAVTYRSRSAAAVSIAANSKKTNSEIARLVGMTPQTVKFAIDRAVGKLDR
jgi:predicted transcriptional regulator